MKGRSQVNYCVVQSSSADDNHMYLEFSMIVRVFFWLSPLYGTGVLVKSEACLSLIISHLTWTDGDTAQRYKSSLQFPSIRSKSIRYEVHKTFTTHPCVGSERRQSTIYHPENNFDFPSPLTTVKSLGPTSRYPTSVLPSSNTIPFASGAVAFGVGRGAISA